MSAVPQVLRGQANAVCIFFSHLLGDFPSPYIIGLLIDKVGRQEAMIFVLSWLLTAVAFWGTACVLSCRRGREETHLKLIMSSDKK